MLLLASRSPRRRQLLEQLGVEFSVVDVDVPEVRAVGEAPRDYVVRVARDKALAGLARARPGGWVLAADTEVIVDDVVFGKPVDAADAARMLRLLSGREHDVVTALWLMSGDGKQVAVSDSRVCVAALAESDIDEYLSSGEWLGKAGAYAIQGRFGAHVSELRGSFSGVMGLPLHETATLLKAAGCR